MALNPQQRPVQQSILDRLLDAEPYSTVEAPQTRSQSIRQLKAALRRDLEWLLNTRQCIETVDGFPELRTSVFTYGLPDITSIRLESGQDEQRLLRAMETAIQLFEPRLANVRVIAVEPLTKRARELRFHIEGLLLLDPAPELIAFDTTLDVSRGDYEVRE
jgi:type VI secretion system protein ImpF